MSSDEIMVLAAGNPIDEDSSRLPEIKIVIGSAIAVVVSAANTAAETNVFIFCP
jgi:hypothetical protein